MNKSKTSTDRNEKNDDSGLSKNHSKSIRYRLRIQQDKEAEEELKEFERDELYRSTELPGSHEA